MRKWQGKERWGLVGYHSKGLPATLSIVNEKKRQPGKGWLPVSYIARSIRLLQNRHALLVKVDLPEKLL
jgi:hypothetical protein